MAYRPTSRRASKKKGAGLRFVTGYTNRKKASIVPGPQEHKSRREEVVAKHGMTLLNAIGKRSNRRSSEDLLFLKLYVCSLRKEYDALNMHESPVRFGKCRRP